MVTLQGLVQVVIFLIVAGLIFWLLRDVLPALAHYDFPSSADAYVKQVGELLKSEIAASKLGSHQADLLNGQSRMRMILSMWHLSFLASIFHVLRMCAKKEMAGIYAARVVATRTIVAYVHPLGYFSKSNLPRNAMSKQHLSAASSVFASLQSAIRQVYLSVAFSVLRACPEPATVRLCDFGPKPGDEFCGIKLNHDLDLFIRSELLGEAEREPTFRSAFLF